MSGKSKYLEDAALVIDGRVKALKEELKLSKIVGCSTASLAADRAAILEAELLAKYIRHLKFGTYRDHPYEVAKRRRNEHGDMRVQPPDTH